MGINKLIGYYWFNGQRVRVDVFSKERMVHLYADLEAPHGSYELYMRGVPLEDYYLRLTQFEDDTTRTPVDSVDIVVGSDLAEAKAARDVLHKYHPDILGAEKILADSGYPHMERREKAALAEVKTYARYHGLLPTEFQPDDGTTIAVRIEPYKGIGATWTVRQKMKQNAGS